MTQSPIKPISNYQTVTSTPNSTKDNLPQPSQVTMPKTDGVVKKEVNTAAAEVASECGGAPSSSECDSNDGMLQIKGKSSTIFLKVFLVNDFLVKRNGECFILKNLQFGYTFPFHCHKKF